MRKTQSASSRRSTSMSVLNQSIRSTEYLASKALRLSATDHYGWDRVFTSMASMGIVEAIQYLLMHLFLVLLSAAISTLWILAILFIVIPFLLTGRL